MLLLLLSSLLLLFELLLFDSDSGSDSVMPDSDAMRRTYSLSAAYLHKLGLATPTQALPPCRLGCTFRAAPAQARKKERMSRHFILFGKFTLKRQKEKQKKSKNQSDSDSEREAKWESVKNWNFLSSRLRRMTLKTAWWQPPEPNELC